MAVFLYNNDIFTSRMPKARLEKALKQREMISDEDYAKVIGLANIVRPVRSFLFKTPDVYGMTYEEHFIPSIDGVPIEMWYIPVKGAPSDKLVIFNPALPKMKVALYSQCMGVNSQYHAIYRRPELFENVRCMVSPMVVSMAAIFDLVSSKEKELHWIENTPYRFKDGYNYFGREPEKVLAFLDAHMN